VRRRPDFPWIGNHPATDLCNTEPVIDGEQVDLLPDVEALGAWVAGAGVETDVAVADLGRTDRQRTLAFVHRLRATVRAVIEAGAEDAAALHDLNDVLAPERGALQVGPGIERHIALHAAGAGAQLRLDVAAAVVDLFRHDPRLIRRCANLACVLLFLDVSKSGRRRWCDMATCGNRAKAAAHHARSTRGTTAR
jgi:predicted RNA-binding Zn ribbon-like protein